MLFVEVLEANGKRANHLYSANDRASAQPTEVATIFKIQDGANRLSASSAYSIPIIPMVRRFVCVIALVFNFGFKGISRPRRAKSGNSLPNPRILSGSIHQQEDVNGNFTHMLMQFGQFLDHDISLSPVNQLGSGGIQCCKGRSHPDCFPIEIPPNDAFYGQENKRCLNFVRSVSCQTCRLGPRLQLNELTSFIDASNMYGNTIDATRSLRAFTSGAIQSMLPCSCLLSTVLNCHYRTASVRSRQTGPRNFA